MQRSSISRLALAAALLAAGLASPAAIAQEQTDAPPAASISRGAVSVQSLSGAYLAAKAAQAAGSLDTATDYYEHALAIDPTSLVLQQEAMFAFLADGRFEKGVELAARLEDDEESGKVARIALGIDGLKDGDYAATLHQLDIKDASELDQLLIGHLSAWAEVGLGQPEKALTRIDEMKGTSWFPIFNLYQKGLIYALSGQPDEARRVLKVLLDDRASLQTSPDAYLAAAETLARIEAREGKQKEALAAIQTGLDIAPAYDPLIFLKKEIETGADIAPPIASARDGAAEVLYILGQAVNRGEGQQVALLYFQFADAVVPQASPKLLTALADVAERGQRVDLAISYYKQIPENSAYRRTADLQMGLDLWYADRKAEAKEHLARAVEQYPDDLQAHLAYADVLSADKDYASAAKVLDRALEIAPEKGPQNWNIYYQRGIAHERLKQWDKAEPDFRKALELSPNQPQVLNYLGYSWVDMNRNLDEGLELIRTAVDLRPNDGYIIDSLGWAYYRLGRFDEAVEQLERAVLITPADPTINDHLGDAYWRVDRKREAHFQWQRALDGTPEPEPEVVEKIRNKLANGLPAVDDDPEIRHQEPDAQKPDERASATGEQPPAGNGAN